MRRIFRILLILIFIMLSISGVSTSGRMSGDDSSDHFSHSHNLFAISLYHDLRMGRGNLFVSPYSIYNVMLMVAEGARGETAVEFREVLQFGDSLRSDQDDIPWDLSPFHSWIAELNSKYNFSNEEELRGEIAELEQAYMDSIAAPLDIPGLTDSAQYFSELMLREQIAAEKLEEAQEGLPSYEVRLANAVWAEKTFDIYDDYRNTMEKYYADGGIFSADFKHDCEGEKRKVNNWVKMRTKGRITQIMNNCSPLIRLVLVNAMYFNGKWRHQFEYKDTKERDFFLTAGVTVSTRIMTNRHYGHYAAFKADGSFFNTPRYIYKGQKEGLYPDSDGFSMVEMTYKACDLSMVFIAPNSPDGLRELESMLTLDNLTGWIDDICAREVIVYIPKFKMEDKIELNPVLKRLGLQMVFNDLKADLSGISAISPQRNLYVDYVLQKSFVKVNEKGTEAAAATMVRIDVTSSQRDDNKIPFTPVFRADRPFIYIIRDRTTGMLLFIGRFEKP